MRLAILLSLALALGAARPGSAQEADRPGAEELRRRIEARFSSWVQEELGLTDAEAARLRTASAAYADRRRALEARERELRRGLAGQLRPGVAADQDSVARLTDALLQLKADRLQITRDEMRELAGFLTPVQRAQYFMLRERLRRRIHEVRAEWHDSHPHHGSGRGDFSR